jgi:hypothetical protein
MVNYIVDENIIEKNEEDVLYLLNMDDATNVLYKIEGVAKLFWEGVCKKRLDCVVKEVCGKYDTTTTIVKSDLDSFVDRLIELKIIKEEE